MRIKVYTDYNEFKNQKFFTNFEVIEEMPAIGSYYNNEEVTKIEELIIDCEQGNDEVYNYEYYRLTTSYYDDFTYIYYS